MQRQRFVTTIKKCDWEKKPTQKLNWISQCDKIDNYNRGGKEKEKEKEKNSKVSTEQT